MLHLGLRIMHDLYRRWGLGLDKHSAKFGMNIPRQSSGGAIMSIFILSVALSARLSSQTFLACLAHVQPLTSDFTRFGAINRGTTIHRSCLRVPPWDPVRLIYGYNESVHSKLQHGIIL
jgi:hypothetical protein